jgi:hypothetical protein
MVNIKNNTNGKPFIEINNFVMATKEIGADDRLLWVEGITDYDDLIKRFPNETEKYIMDEMIKIELQSEPFIEINCPNLGINDLIIFKLDYTNHSWNRFYVQYNKISKKRRIVITFMRRQGKKFDDLYLAPIKQNGKIVQEIKKVFSIDNFNFEKDLVRV